jgi:flagellar biosynthetic protein FliR
MGAPYALSLPIGSVEAFLLIATRVLAVLATSPVFSIKSVPMQAKLGLGLFTALILMPVVTRDAPLTVVDVSWSALAGEALLGALSGFAATLAYTAIAFGANLLDLQAGFSMAALYDSAFGNQGALLERFYNALAALLFFQTDAHHLVIQSLVQMFTLVPLGSFSLSRINPEILAQIAAGSFMVAVELIFPVLVALLLAEIAMGVLAKVAPQFGIFQIGLQIKVGLALAAVAVTMPLLLPRIHALFGGMVAISVAVLR